MKEVMVKAALEAGNLVMNNFHKKHEIHEKSHQDFVTETDKASEKLIKEIIKSHFPDHNIVSEESHRENRGSEYTWFIDPVDGTHNFMKGIPLFGVNIALMKNEEIILGVMNLPALDMFLVAEKGKGCFINDKKVHVSDKSFEDALFVTSTHLKDHKNISDQIVKVANETFSLRTLGCAALDTLLVANGGCDFYLCHNVKPWDIAPGIIAVKEAGGKVTDYKGDKPSVWMADLIFSNKKTHGDLLRCLK